MAVNTTSHSGTNTKSILGASIIFTAIIVLAVILSWRFTPPPLLFSEDFENTERNQQYLPCAAFTIEQGRLRVTVAQSHSGCAVRLPNEYDDYTFTTSVYPVENVYDGSVNILFRQNDNGGYEIQFRPNEQQVNFIETAKNANRESYIKFTTGWMQTPVVGFNSSENKIKLTITRNAFDFWFNDVLIFRNISANETPNERGIISIGAGAGEVGGIAFEFDDIEIYAERLYSRWMHDFLAIVEIRKLGQ
jgi:hypothetical protein